MDFLTELGISDISIEVITKGFEDDATAEERELAATELEELRLAVRDMQKCLADIRQARD